MSKDDLVPPKSTKKKGESKVKKAIKDLVETAVKVYDGASHLILAIALVITAYYNYSTLTSDLSEFEYYARVVASVVIGLTGAWQVVKVFKAVGEKK